MHSLTLSVDFVLFSLNTNFLSYSVTYIYVETKLKCCDPTPCGAFGANLDYVKTQVKADAE